MKYLIIFASMYIALNLNINAVAKEKSERMLLDGTENLLQFGIDSTGNWWAVTEPFSGQYRVHINGKESTTFSELKGLKFAASGNRWAFFGRNHSGWNIIANDTIISFNASLVDEIQFSNTNDAISYSYIDAGQEKIVLDDRIIPTYSRHGKYFVSQKGKRYAYVSKRGNSYIMNINGKESQIFDEILPIGFKYNDEFLFAARNGNLWEIFQNETPITETYKNVSEAVINADGTSVGVIVKLYSDYYQTILFNDEYIEPLFSNQYDIIQDLVLHPYEPMLACRAMLNNSYFVLLNSTEYNADEGCSKPQFTYDGSELFYIFCRISCSIGINGKKYKLPMQLDPNYTFAKKPKAMNICFPTNTSMCVQEIETNDLYASLLIDRICNPIYNRHTGFYESLASINNRLYYMGIKP